jgi:Transposase DDE domain group 1
VIAIERPWILDLDATVKTVYGHQDGAQVGYNPHKPRRPSYALHTYWVGNLRLVLDVQMCTGKQSGSGHAKAHLAHLLEQLGGKGPALIRGDCGYGNQDIIEVCEAANRPYLLRLRKTANAQAAH